MTLDEWKLLLNVNIRMDWSSHRLVDWTQNVIRQTFINFFFFCDIKILMEKQIKVSCLVEYWHSKLEKKNQSWKGRSEFDVSRWKWYCLSASWIFILLKRFFPSNKKTRNNPINSASSSMNFLAFWIYFFEKRTRPHFSAMFIFSKQPPCTERVQQ